MRLRPLIWTGSLGVLACSSAPASAPDPDVAETRQSIIEGYVDNDSTGIVGVGVNVPGLFSSWMCSGTLIAPNLVVTARHCVSFSGGGDNGVICGEAGFGFNGGGSAFRITPISPRPDVEGDAETFVYAGTSTVRHVPGDDLCGSDMALIILEENIPALAATPIIPRIDQPAISDEIISAAGFGLIDPDPEQGRNNIRHRLDNETVRCAGEGCRAVLGGGAYATEFQSMARTCQGDSGGPALDADGKLLGVLSRGPQGCLSSIFGDVGAWGDFVIETAIEAAEMGGYPPPYWTSGSSLPLVVGDPCGGHCGLGLLCDMEAGAEEGECVPGCLEQGGCTTGLECDLEPGECVPRCAEEGECPEDLACDVENGTCVDPARLLDPTPPPTDTASDGGCSVNGRSNSESTWGWLAALAALGVAGARRRRINRTR